jgi:hypothetical protein
MVLKKYDFFKKIKQDGSGTTKAIERIVDKKNLI